MTHSAAPAGRAASLKPSVIALYVLLLAANIGAWGAAFLLFRDKPVLIGTAFLAYVFGLRHAFDADHIAAIDNAVRKLMQEGRKPVGIGFFFSLGHSSIVIIASGLIAAGGGPNLPRTQTSPVSSTRRLCCLSQTSWAPLRMFHAKPLKRRVGHTP